MNKQQICIETAKPSHAEQICQVIIASITELCALDHKNDPRLLHEWLQNKTIENICQWIASRNISLIALSEGKVVGIIMLAPEGLILLNYIHPHYSNKGIGSLLLNNLELLAKETNITNLTVHSTKTASPFYQRRYYVKLTEDEECVTLTKELA